MARVKKRISIVLVDDNSSPRDAVVDRLAAARGLRVLTFPAELEALPVAIRENRPDIILLNLAGKGKRRQTFATALHGAAPGVPVIIMGLAPRREDVMSLVRTGVAGFIMANAPLEVYLSTILLVAHGMRVLPPALTHGLFVQLRGRMLAPNSIH
jgi:DNA-binding NarL/FixJ family response regulator